MHPNSFRFEVNDGEVVVSEFQQYESRGDACLEILRQLVRKGVSLLDGRQGVVDYGDNPSDFTRNGDLHFSVTHPYQRISKALPFPCWATLNWPEIGVPDSNILFKELLENSQAPTDSRIFWIGADTHPSRVALCKIAAIRPDVLDASLMSWNRANPKNLTSHGRFVSIQDHARYKYLIDCPGYGYSARLKWLLATGRPVFFVAAESVEHWANSLIPWVHFVPVREDLSDLLENHITLQKDPELCQSIGENAREFIIENVILDAQLDKIFCKIKEEIERSI